MLNTQSPAGNYDPSGARSEIENLKGMVWHGQEIQ